MAGLLERRGRGVMDALRRRQVTGGHRGVQVRPARGGAGQGGTDLPTNQLVELGPLTDDAATEREVAARERHAAGLAAMAEILDAEAQLAAADQQQIDARSASWMAAATLARAIGR